VTSTVYRKVEKSGSRSARELVHTEVAHPQGLPPPPTSNLLDLDSRRRMNGGQAEHRSVRAEVRCRSGNCR